VRIDARSLTSGTELEADVAVVGAGPAGITLALELADAGHSVLVIESGGDKPNAQTQRLADTAGEDPGHAGMRIATRRQVGGASNIWGGRCVPFDPIDFQPRRATEGARWPVGYAELEGYYARACTWCKCGEAVFNVRNAANLAGRAIVPGWKEGEMSAATLERWSLPTNFAREYGTRMANAPRLRLVRNLTCTEIVCAQDGASVEHLTARTEEGKSVKVRAARYVLACGGLEATRLLLASDRVHPGGIGNHAGHLGRWYMGHVEARIARVHFTTPPEETIYDYERTPDGVYVRRRFTFSPQCLIQHELPNMAMWLENPEMSDAGHRKGVMSLVYLLLVSPLGGYLVSEGIREHQINATIRTPARAHVANVVRDLRATTAFALSFGYRRVLKRGRKAPGFFVPSRTNVYDLLYQGEHLPNHASHVELTSTRDAVGVRRLATHIAIAERDLQGAVRAHELFDAYLQRHKVGHLEYIYKDPKRAIRERLSSGCHQSGTTRMAANPADGVLDPNGAVHGCENLYVASSSAFPTSSQANSTFMIVVFALRLADHLQRRMSEG
jgi:choline dehydrogenase-like flavoprotein